MERKRHQQIRYSKLTKWYKDMSKMKYKDNKLRITVKGLESIRNALEHYRIKNKWNEEYTDFLEKLEVEILMLLCKEKFD